MKFWKRQNKDGQRLEHFQVSREKVEKHWRS